MKLVFSFIFSLILVDMANKWTTIHYQHSHFFFKFNHFLVNFSLKATLTFFFFFFCWKIRMFKGSPSIHKDEKYKYLLIILKYIMLRHIYIYWVKISTLFYKLLILIAKRTPKSLSFISNITSMSIIIYYSFTFFFILSLSNLEGINLNFVLHSLFVPSQCNWIISFTLTWL